jgi:hypothetical protein
MAQHEDLDIFGTIPAAAQHEQVDHEADKTVETGHAPILAAPEPPRSRHHETPGQHARTSFRHPQAIWDRQASWFGDARLETVAPVVMCGCACGVTRPEPAICARSRQ